MNRVAKDILMHYGMPRRSGRYPWGSGKNYAQDGGDFYDRVYKLRKEGGMKEADIAKALGCESTTELRVLYTNAKNERRRYKMESARALMDDGKSLAEAARAMGEAESTVRSYLNEGAAARMNKAQNMANFLKDKVEERGMIDVGAGVERELNISKVKMAEALAILKEEGYPVYGGGIPQVTNPGRQSNMQVLCPPGTEHKEIFKFDNVNSVTDYKVRVDENGNDIVDKGFKYPKSMDSSRLAIRYAEDGGSLKDGVVELRRGVDDVSLGESRYAQVRILVDGDKYIKGMALYADDADLPPGKDVLFNTNKKVGTPLEKVLKPITADPDNPFGSAIKEKGGQSEYVDKDGVKQLSLINKRADEGDWGEWADRLPSQFLAKQSNELIKRQLGLAIDEKQAEFDEINALTNPTVKKEMLRSFADDCDSAAVHLQAAALPRQKYQVILPISSLKDTEVFAPNFEDGETVALIRYPHGGTFEIPVLTVTKHNAEANKLLGGNANDVVGINSKVAARLSGADFDGDTVMVIPCNSDSSRVKIVSTRSLPQLEGFDHRMEYPERQGMPVMKRTQLEMGKISNLIMDMTLGGATRDELARAVKHSMVVIDAEKHHLDYKKSEEENAITALKKKYQGRVDADGNYHQGAATLLTRAASEYSVDKRVGSPKVNQIGKKWYNPDLPEGELIWTSKHEEYPVSKKLKDEDGKYIIDEATGKPVKQYTGQYKLKTQKSTQMAEVRDAMDLSAGNIQERFYAEYANKMKAMANDARKEMVYTGKIEYNASAKAAYAQEVQSLNSHLNDALKNHPRERMAQRIANSAVDAKKSRNYDMTTKDLKKLKNQELARARIKVGAESNKVKITAREWEAIQAGAITENILKSIIQNTDGDNLRQLATPRTTKTVSAGKMAKMQAMKSSGMYTNSEIAASVGLSPSTVSEYLKGKE